MRISDWSSDVCSSDLDQAVSRVILCLPGGFLCGAQRFDELQIVFTKFSEHVLRRHIFSVVVLNGLTPRYVANRPKRRVAGLADSLSDEISRGQNLRGMIIKHRSEEQTSELQSLMRLSYAVFSLNKKKQTCTITMIQQ